MLEAPSSSGPNKGETWEEYQARRDQEIADKERKADLEHLGCSEGKSTNLEETDRPYEMLSEAQANTRSDEQPPETDKSDKDTSEDAILGAREATSEVGRKDRANFIL